MSLLSDTVVLDGSLRFCQFALEFLFLKMHPLLLILLSLSFFSFNIMLSVFKEKIKYFKMGFHLKKNPHLSFYNLGVENLGVKAVASHISVLLTYLIIHGRSEDVSSG